MENISLKQGELLTPVSLLRFAPLIKVGREGGGVGGGGGGGGGGAREQEHLQHAEFLETEAGTGVVFVADNNIYHQPSLSSRCVAV